MPHVGELVVAQDPKWIAVTVFIGAWGNFGGGYAPAGYYKDVLGVVHLRGMVSGGVVPGGIFTLPVGYRPLFRSSFAVDSNGGHGACDVQAGGTVAAQPGGVGAQFSLEGVSFRAEQ